jgi:hypothetical protein
MWNNLGQRDKPPARVQLLALAAALIISSAAVRAGTIVLTVNNPLDPNTYSSISAAVDFADKDLNLNNYYDIQITELDPENETVG